MPKKRPTYESSGDRSRELTFADEIGESWGCVLRKTPPYYHVDFMGLQHEGQGAKIRFFVEMKHRNIKSTQYPTYLLSLKKWLNMNLISKHGGVPVVLAVRFTDRDLFMYVTGETFPLSYMGRTDRDDDADLEPCIAIPMNRLSPTVGILDVTDTSD